MYRHLHSKRCSCINGYDVEASDGSRKIITSPVVWVVQLDQHAVCVVSSKLGANGCRAVVWYVVQPRGAF